MSYQLLWITQIGFIFALFITSLKGQDVEFFKIPYVSFNTHCGMFLSFPNMASTIASTNKFIRSLDCKLDGRKCLEFQPFFSLSPTLDIYAVVLKFSFNSMRGEFSLIFKQQQIITSIRPNFKHIIICKYYFASNCVTVSFLLTDI